MRRLGGELCGAFMLLTRLPMPRHAAYGAACIWAYPLVGAVVGAIGALAFRAATIFPAPIAALCALAAMILATGALHEDGLADTADGLGGGDRERALAIMRDSRIGSFGALALVFSVLLRAAAITALGDPRTVAAGLVAAGALGRGAIVLLLLLLRPARTDGLSAALGAVPRGRAAVGLLLALAIALGVLPCWQAWMCLATGIGCTFGVAWLARRRIGGHTGDVLGAGEQVCGCLVLVVLTG